MTITPATLDALRQALSRAGLTPEQANRLATATPEELVLLAVEVLAVEDSAVFTWRRL